MQASPASGFGSARPKSRDDLPAGAAAPRKSDRPAATILIADDNRDAVDAMREVLRTIGYAVVPAYSVREALDLLDEPGDIGLVISDIRMPDVDGFDLIRVLRHRFPTLPTILVTGLPVTDRDVVPPGAVILEKPVGMDELQRAVTAKLAAQ